MLSEIHLLIMKGADMVIAEMASKILHFSGSGRLVNTGLFLMKKWILIIGKIKRTFKRGVKRNI